MTWEEAKAACPTHVFPACHNSEDTVTISGYAEPVKQFVTKLQQQGYFAKEVNSCGVAFHSPCIQKAASAILEKMTKVLFVAFRL
jgi:fatty acid synthase